MNLTSAGVKPTFDRSRACSAPTTLLGSPGAPGWTIAGAPPAPERHDAAAKAVNTRAANRRRFVMMAAPGRAPGRESYRTTVRAAGVVCGAMLAHSPVDVVTLDVAPLPAARLEPVERPVRWRLRTRVAFRLCFLYFSLYVITTQML